MNYTDLLEQRVDELKPIIKQIKSKAFLSSYELLPNYKTAEKCCASCWFYSAGYEGEGDCKILEDLSKKFTELWVSQNVCADCLCDYWEKKR